MFAVAMLYFIWGVYKFWIGSEGADNRLQGANHVLYGLLGMVIMIGVFVIMSFIQNTLGITSDDRPPVLPSQ